MAPSLGECSQSGDGGGEPTIFKGCPADCTPLSRPDTYLQLGVASCGMEVRKELAVFFCCWAVWKMELVVGGAGKDDIDLHVESSANHSCNEWNENCSTSKVIDIQVNADHVVLRFDSNPGLLTGDLIVLENVTGGSDEENRIVSGQIGVEHMGHPVTRLNSGHPGAEEGLIFSIPVRLGTGNRPPFLPGNGGWNKPNLAKSKEELLATEAKTDLQVCWGSLPDTYHLRAGRVSFVTPDKMPLASLHLTSIEGGRSSPLLLQFTTNSLGAAKRYGLAEGSMRLRIRQGYSRD
eukprot:symbB.v1.2.011021.t1/scaffold731.1/size168158/2